MRAGITLLVLTSSLFLARPAAAWNGVGHMAVAKVAYDGLSDAGRKRAQEILSRHPHYEAYLTKNRPANVDVGEWVFLRASTWPDWVRGPLKPEKPDPAVVRFHRPGDHYTNRPVFAKDATPEFAAKVRAKPDRSDVLCALKQRAAEFGLPTAAPEDRAVALCWLLHLVGDVHQPLHCAGLYAEPLFPPPGGDLGGNAVGVRVRGEKVRLHTYWDGLLGTTADLTAEVRDTPQYTEEAYKVATLAAERIRKANPRESLAELTKPTEFRDWVAEGFEIAEKVAYWDGAIMQRAVLVPPGYPPAIPDTAKEVPDGYAGKAAAVADRRAAVAGYRLADLLGHILPGE